MAAKGTATSDSVRQYRRILRPVQYGAQTLRPGEVVDVTDWRPTNLTALVQQGRVSEYIVDAP